MMKYIVNKIVDGEKFYQGTWKDPVRMAEAMFDMGRNCSFIDDVEIVVEEKDEDGNN